MSFSILSFVFVVFSISESVHGTRDVVHASLAINRSLPGTSFPARSLHAKSRKLGVMLLSRVFALGSRTTRGARRRAEGIVWRRSQQSMQSDRDSTNAISESPSERESRLQRPPTAIHPSRASNCLANIQWPEEWPYSDSDLKPEDASRDEMFYIMPKFVHHAAPEARERLTEYYEFVLPKEGTGSVLDLCSSWTSHYPEGWRGNRVVALGLNPFELARNPSKTEFKVQNLNTELRLPFDEGEFDLITNSLSADYLTNPLETFKEMRRVLKVGGIAACAFTNRCFPTKVVPMWSKPFDDLKHIQIIASYFHFAGFDEISVVDMSPEGWDGVKNPMFIVQAMKLAP